MKLPNYFEVLELAEERPHLATALEQFRRWVIEQAIVRNDGNKKAAALELGIGYSTLKMHMSTARWPA